MKKYKKIKLKAKSHINPELTITEVLQKKVEWVFDNEVYQKPHLTWISVGQTIWGNGKHWKDCDDECLKAGIREHLGIRKASNEARNRWANVWGWEVPEFPQSLYDTIKSIIKSKIINPMIFDEKYTGISPFYAQGYIDPKTDPPTFNSRYAKSIAGWFFYLNDPNIKKISEKYLTSLFDTKDAHIPFQWEYNKSGFPKMIRQQIASSSKKLDLVYQLEKYSGYKNIGLKIDQDLITWEIEDD